MKKLLTLAFCLALSSCAIAPVMNTTDLTNVDWSNVENLKEGSSCTYHLFGFLGDFGRSRLPEAVESAGIKRVYAVDQTYGYYILFGRTCLNVWGE